MSVETNVYCGPYLRITKLEQDQSLDRLVDMGLVSEEFLNLMQMVKFEGNPLIECYIPNEVDSRFQTDGENCLDMSLVDINMEKQMFENAYPNFINVMVKASTSWDMCYGFLRWYT